MNILGVRINGVRSSSAARKIVEASSKLGLTGLYRNTIFISDLFSSLDKDNGFMQIRKGYNSRANLLMKEIKACVGTNKINCTKEAISIQKREAQKLIGKCLFENIGSRQEIRYLEILLYRATTKEEIDSVVYKINKIINGTEQGIKNHDVQLRSTSISSTNSGSVSPSRSRSRSCDNKPLIMHIWDF